MNSCHTVPKCKHAKTWKRCCTHEFSPSSVLQSLDDGRPEQPPQQKAPLRQETNMANFSYRFSIYNINGQPHTDTHSLWQSDFRTYFLSCSVCGLVSHPDVSVSAEALNQGENVDLDALMADLCSIEQELSTINTKPNSAGSLARLGLTDTKVNTVHVVGFL